MKLLAGLGNPGDRYTSTRHNIGFMVIDALATRWQAGSERNRFRSQSMETVVNGEKLLLLKPQTYMNRSGEAVIAAMDYYDLAPSDLIVIHDDKDLDFARMKIRVGGSDGGHKGIRSIISHLHDPAFCRCRIGVGRPRHGEDTADFVLSRFYSDEAADLPTWVDISAEAVEAVLSNGPEKAANHFNGKLWIGDLSISE